MMKFYSHGKLLLSGEYMVLKGAKSLALPCKKGQSLEFEPDGSKKLKWESWDIDHQLWFSATIGIADFDVIETSDLKTAENLVTILKAIRRQKNSFLKNEGGKVTTRLEFDLHWGLGTSSTLISNLAQWSQTDPYALLEASFGGSGYDIACATANGPLIYQKGSKGAEIQICEFDPPFKSNLYFVYLNQKKNSREAVNQFKKQKISPKQITQSSELSESMIRAKSLKKFEQILIEHERFIGNILGIKPVKEKLFSDFGGSVKSLGAWGGDFVLACGDQNTPEYFINKGFPVVLGYQEMML